MEPTTVTVSIRDDEADLVAGQLWALGTIGVEERPDALVGHFADRAAAEAAAGALGPAAQVSERVEVDWVDAQRDWATATVAGPFLVHPPWVDAEPEQALIDLVIDPGATFGHGGHPTTKLILEALPRVVEPTDRVLDVGCGSGVLAIAAVALGAARATAIDIDLDAVETTELNAASNGFADRIDVSATPIEQVEGRFEVVMVNLTAGTLVPLLPHVRSRCSGLLVVSGMLDEQVDDVIAALPGDTLIGRTSADGWTALTIACRHDPPAS